MTPAAGPGHQAPCRTVIKRHQSTDSESELPHVHYMRCPVKLRQGKLPAPTACVHEHTEASKVLRTRRNGAELSRLYIQLHAGRNEWQVGRIGPSLLLIVRAHTMARPRAQCRHQGSPLPTSASLCAHVAHQPWSLCKHGAWVQAACMSRRAADI